MAYGKKAHLNDNIQAIETALRLEKEKRRATSSEREILSRYSGFGGLKCILNPARTPEDVSRWKKSELSLFPLVAGLHRTIRDYAVNEKVYNRYVDSLKQSVLTAFYTPPVIVESIAHALRNSGITPARLLEPSAGTGAFVAAFNPENSVETVAFEKDLLTGKILQALYPDSDIRIEGFENIKQKQLGTFDLVTSNIPFGDTSVFDLSYSRGTSSTKQQAARSIHNYFFLKGLDALQEGGVLAFITSQGVMNSERNAPVRQYLMENSRLIAAVRFPNNLFSDYAGTDVGTDLIILQKQTGKGVTNETEQKFIEIDDGELPVNSLLADISRNIYTTREMGTDLYGKPAWILLHEQGLEGIVSDLRIKLGEQIEQSDLDIARFEKQGQQLNQRKVIRETEPEKDIVASAFPKPEEPILSLYDLFGFSAQERSQITPASKKQKLRNNASKTKHLVHPRAPHPSNGRSSSQPEVTTQLPSVEEVINDFFARQDPFSISNCFSDEWRLEIQHTAR